MAELKLARKDIVRSTLFNYKLKNQEIDHRDFDEYLTKNDIASAYCVDESVMVDSKGILYTNDRYVPLSLIVGKYPFTINKTNVDFSTANISSDTFDINFLTNFNTWTASSNQSWLVLNKTSGNGTTTNINMTTDVNESFSSRNATITITATQYENMSININVTQAANTNYSTLTVSSSNTNFDYGGGSATLSASENVYWNFSNKHIRTNSVTSSTTFSSSNSPQFSVNGNSLSVRYNDYRYSRSATITGTWNSMSNTVSLYQSLSPIRLEGIPDTLYFITEGENKGFNLSSNTSWEITGMPVGCTINKKTGSGDATIDINYAPKTDEGDRSGIIYVTPESNIYSRKQFTVYQYGRTLSIDPTSLSFAVEGGDKSLNVYSNSSWTATVSGTGFSCIGSSGWGNAPIKIRAANNIGAERGGSVTISSGSLSRTCSLSQSASYYLRTNLSSIYLEPNAGTASDAIFTNIPFDNLSIGSNATDNWCRPSLFTDSIGTRYKLNYDQNTGTTEIGYRDCTIYLRGFGETATVYVRQNNPKPVSRKYVNFGIYIDQSEIPTLMIPPFSGGFRIQMDGGKELFSTLKLDAELAGGGSYITIDATTLLSNYSGQEITLTINCDVYYDRENHRVADMINSANRFTEKSPPDKAFWHGTFRIPYDDGGVIDFGEIHLIRHYM